MATLSFVRSAAGRFIVNPLPPSLTGEVFVNLQRIPSGGSPIDRYTCLPLPSGVGTVADSRLSTHRPGLSSGAAALVAGLSVFLAGREAAAQTGTEMSGLSYLGVLVGIPLAWILVKKGILKLQDRYNHAGNLLEAATKGDVKSFDQLISQIVESDKALDWIKRVPGFFTMIELSQPQWQLNYRLARARKRQASEAIASLVEARPSGLFGTERPEQERLALVDVLLRLLSTFDNSRTPLFGEDHTQQRIMNLVSQQVIEIAQGLTPASCYDLLMRIRGDKRKFTSQLGIMGEIFKFLSPEQRETHCALLLGELRAKKNRFDNLKELVLLLPPPLLTPETHCQCTLEIERLLEDADFYDVIGSEGVGTCLYPVPKVLGLAVRHLEPDQQFEIVQRLDDRGAKLMTEGLGFANASEFGDRWDQAFSYVVLNLCPEAGRRLMAKVLDRAEAGYKVGQDPSRDYVLLRVVSSSFFGIRESLRLAELVLMGDPDKQLFAQLKRVLEDLPLRQAEGTEEWKGFHVSPFILDEQLLAVLHMQEALLDGKKALIMGIRPRANLPMNPRDFLGEVEKQTSVTASQGNCDLLLLPSEPSQQSHRDFLLREIKEKGYREITFQTSLTGPMFSGNSFLVAWQRGVTPSSQPALGPSG